MIYLKNIPETLSDPDKEAYQIRDYDPPTPSGIYCRDALAEYLTGVTMAHNSWEDWIVIQALIKKGALLPSSNAPTQWVIC